VTLDEFMDCPHNLATNRQTRMLANLLLIGCYNASKIVNQTQRQSIMFNSAVTNLQKLKFFGLLENQSETQTLFEQTFSVRFTQSFVQSNITHAEEAEPEVTVEQLRRIVQLNQLDIQLYNYAKQLFEARVSKINLKDGDLDNNRLGEVRNEFSDDDDDDDGDDEEEEEEDDDYRSQ